jgi:tRNA threonylcarbamoyladenosine biosynthesis protein TsaE
MTRDQITMMAADEAEMVALGALLGAAFEPGMVVFLEGDLGMGKTTFSRGFIQSLGHTGAVKSPTYTLVEPYRLRELDVFHFDLYRLGDPEELEFMGIRDYFGDLSVCLVEWPERGLGALPSADLVINIERNGQGRRLMFGAVTEQGQRILARMRAESGA